MRLQGGAAARFFGLLRRVIRALSLDVRDLSVSVVSSSITVVFVGAGPLCFFFFMSSVPVLRFAGGGRLRTPGPSALVTLACGVSNFFRCLVSFGQTSAGRFLRIALRISAKVISSSLASSSLLLPVSSSLSSLTGGGLAFGTGFFRTGTLGEVRRRAASLRAILSAWLKPPVVMCVSRHVRGCLLEIASSS